MTEDEIRAALSDTQALAVTLYGEARSEPVEGRIAVGNVVRNRMAKRFATVKGICLAEHQFSCWNRDESANHNRVVQAAERLLMPDQPLTDAALRECYFIAQGIVGGALQDNTKGSSHYHTATLMPRPKWAVGQTPVAQIGAHLFYSGIA
jgi:N-acetylmuramoyl-L-alanine amidase